MKTRKFDFAKNDSEVSLERNSTKKKPYKRSSTIQRNRHNHYMDADDELVLDLKMGRI